MDTLLHELLIQSEHRTFDPEEADFFYVPQYSTCLIYPILGWADYPWFPVPGLGEFFLALPLSPPSLFLSRVYY